MAACVCRAMRTALAVTVRSACTGPNRTHAHYCGTDSSGPSAARVQEQTSPGVGPSPGAGSGSGPSPVDYGGSGPHAAVVLWAALGFSLFGRSEEDERNEAQRKHDEMILLLKKAKLSLHRDQMSAASSFLHQALALAQQLHHLDALVYCYSLMANVAFVRGQLDQAERLFKASLSVILSRGTAENDNAVIETSLKLATIYAQQNRLDLAEHGFRFCVESLEEKLDKDASEETERTDEQQVELKDSRLLLGLVLDSRARFWTQMSDLVRAEQDYRRSLSICSEEQGADHPQTLVLLSDLATVLDLRGNRSEALDLVRQAVDLGRTQDHPELHVLLCNMAAILLHSGELNVAEQFYHEALTLAKQRGDQEAVEHIQDGLKELRTTKGQQREEETIKGKQREEEPTKGTQREEEPTKGTQREEETTRGQQREENKP